MKGLNRDVTVALVGLLLTALAAGVSAAQSTTEMVKGLAPVATAITGTAAEGQTLTAGFSDADGDAEAGSSYQWYRNNVAIAGATGKTLLLDQAGIGGDRVKVTVTPRTNPAITEPAVGVEASHEVTVAPGAMFSRFITPETTTRDWSSADSYCQSLGGGARLPTVEELKQLFADSTKSPVAAPTAGFVGNNEFCSVHGWPIGGQCGGDGGGYYWSSTPSSAGFHNTISLVTGTAFTTFDSEAAVVACMR